MRHASLFSGIGGPEVAAAMLGWENVFHCEINDFGRKVLEYWFPESDSYDDITKTEFTRYRGTIDVLTGGFPCQPFSYAGRRGGKRTSAISGRKCSELLTKSGRLGSLVKMLLESPLWWSNAGSLKWEVKPLCSKRVAVFTDTEPSMPSPSNASALILSQSDIQSSRCLFRLVLSALRIEETEFSSSPIMLQTPSTREVCETPEQMQQRKERNGYANGTKYNGLMSQIMYDPNCSHLLPTPTAIEGEKYTNTYNPQSQMGKSLSAMAGSGMLPTPAARDWKGKTNPGVVKEGSKCIYGETLPDAVGRMASDQKKDGKTFRLSPLFTEEMMGFPLMWTAYPFLSPSGETKR